MSFKLSIIIFCLLLLISLFVGCSNKIESKVGNETFLDDGKSGVNEYDNPNNSDQVNEINLNEPEHIVNQKTFNVKNLNDAKNSIAKLDLPKEWIGDVYIYDKAPGFEYQAQKNKHIEKVYDYKIYTTSTKEKENLWYCFGTEAIVGEFLTLSYYRDQPEIARFPNHTKVKSREFAGKTILGEGEIFLLEGDIVDMLKTKEHSTFEEVYAWIPIENEPLAYNLCLYVPIGENSAQYVEKAIEILKAH